MIRPQHADRLPNHQPAHQHAGTCYTYPPVCVPLPLVWEEKAFFSSPPCPARSRGLLCFGFCLTRPPPPTVGVLFLGRRVPFFSMLALMLALVGRICPARQRDGAFLFRLMKLLLPSTSMVRQGKGSPGDSPLGVGVLSAQLYGEVVPEYRAQSHSGPDNSPRLAVD